MDWSYPKESHWIDKEVCMRLKPPVGLKAWVFQKDRAHDGRGRSDGWGSHEARLEDLLLTGSSESISQMPYALEGATGIN